MKTKVFLFAIAIFVIVIVLSSCKGGHRVTLSEPTTTSSYTIMTYTPQEFRASVWYVVEPGDTVFSQVASNRSIPIGFEQENGIYAAPLFPFHMEARPHRHSVSVQGVQGTNSLPNRCLVIASDYSTEILPIEIENQSEVSKNLLICGFKADDYYKDATPRTRILIGTSGVEIYVLVAKNATPQQAYHYFEETKLAPTDQAMLIWEGNDTEDLTAIRLNMQ